MKIFNKDNLHEELLKSQTDIISQNLLKKQSLIESKPTFKKVLGNIIF